MTMQECPECKNPVSSEAKACPHCGADRSKGRPWGLYFGVALALVASIAGYGVYTGHRSSAEVEAAAKARIQELGHPPPDIFITRYAKRGSTTYTCGSGSYRNDSGEIQVVLFVAMQTGPMLDWLGIHVEGEKTFAATYTDVCI